MNATIKPVNEKRKNFLDKFAKAIRALAVPPTFVAVLGVCMYALVPTAFRHIGDLSVLLAALALLPALAYPLAAVIPKLKAKGRAGSRSLAFVTSAVGYVGGCLYAFVSGTAGELKFIFVGYIVALAGLLVFNKILKVKASGHACGIFGPLLYAMYFFGTGWFLPCATVGALVVWASVYRKSHTPKELLLGGLCAVLGFSAGLLALLV